MIDNTMTEPSSNPCQLTDDLLPGLRITTKFGTSVLFKSTELRKGDVVYPADQIRAYGDARAAAAVARERERCAKVCDEHASIEGIAQKCAAAIRAGS